jgi:hypothetical protein
MGKDLQEVSDEEREIIRRFIASNKQAWALVLKVLALHLEELRDIKKIDLKGNVGLQTCARSNAYDILSDILTDLDIAEPISKDPKASSFR